MKLVHVDRTSVSPDGLQIALDAKLDDNSNRTIVVPAEYADTISLLLRQAASKARDVRCDLASHGGLVSDPVAVDDIRNLAIVRVAQKDAIVPTLRVQLRSGPQLHLRLDPTVTRYLLDQISEALETLYADEGLN